MHLLRERDKDCWSNLLNGLGGAALIPKKEKIIPGRVTIDHLV